MTQIAQEQQQEESTSKAIKFIKSKFQSPFCEQNTKKLFEYYTLDKNTQRLQPQDIRKLLFDILSASEWPLVVPNESLDAILHELCFNDDKTISWIEFKSLFVFLQDKPLIFLFEIITKLFTQKQILYSRLITIKPIKINKNIIKQQKEEKKNDNNNYNIINKNEQNYYNRNKWKSVIQNLIPKATQIFIHFLDRYQILALAIGKFDNILSKNVISEIALYDSTYLATICAFDAVNGMFPPIIRSGGIKSKVAHKIADSYLITRQWDQHMKLIEKTVTTFDSIYIKYTQLNSQYKLYEKANAPTTSIINSVKIFDKKLQITSRSKQITYKLGSIVGTIFSNDTVQIISNKFCDAFKVIVKMIDDIGQETQQLVQDKRQQNEKNATEMSLSWDTNEKQILLEDVIDDGKELAMQMMCEYLMNEYLIKMKLLPMKC